MSINIGISGIIGVGKSTLTEKLGNILNFDIMREPVETNEYLDKFYNDMNRYSFPMQIYLLNHRFKQHQQMVWSDKNTIQDRTIYEDVIFAKLLNDSNLMEDIDFKTYKQLFDNMANFLHKPDLIVYLNVEPEEALRRIKLRNRECEQNITIEYLTDLKNGYEEWLKSIENNIPIIYLDWNEFQAEEKIAANIQTTLKHKAFNNGTRV